MTLKLNAFTPPVHTVFCFQTIKIHESETRPDKLAWTQRTFNNTLLGFLYNKFNEPDFWNLWTPPRPFLFKLIPETTLLRGGWLFGFFTGVSSQEKYIVPMAPFHYFNGVLFIAYATYPWLRHTLFLFRETLYDLLGWKGHRWLNINCSMATPPWPSLPLFLYITK